MSDAPSSLCGTCTQCCKTMRVDRDDGTVLSEYGHWCPLVEIGVGCKDYANRPKACAGFECVWLQSQKRGKEAERLPPELRPDRCKVVLVAGKVSIVAHVDPHRPDAYHEGPMGRFLASMGQRMVVTAKIGDRGVAIGPHAAKIIEDRLAGRA